MLHYYRSNIDSTLTFQNGDIIVMIPRFGIWGENADRTTGRQKLETKHRYPDTVRYQVRVLVLMNDWIIQKVSNLTFLCSS
jgi:hypothetical protein